MASDKDNPFGEPEDSERTVIRPSPGRRAPPIQPARPPSQAVPSPELAPVPGVDRGRLVEAVVLPEALMGPGVNPVLQAAAVLLAVATRLRRATQQQDVATLRERMIAELRAFERTVRALSLPMNSLRAAHYALCATIDDIVLNTPWGAQSLWAAQSLLSTFHTDVTGGERFFEILNSMQADPGTNIDVLELLYACLALGFEGRYRVHARGASELMKIQDGLYRLIRQVRGDFERELSPHWRGVAAPHRSLASMIPTWVVALVAAVALLVVYMGLSFALNDGSDPAFAALAKLPPRPGVLVAVRAPEPPPPPLPPRRGFLEREVREGIVTVRETAQSFDVTLRTTGMFASGSATVEPRYIAILDRIAAEIQREPGKVQVFGHTDNVPIHTIRFPSNFALSLARAKAAAALIAGKLSDPGRVTSEGRADTDPVAPNGTAAGREANRRIEIIVTKAPRT
ncbi:MAG TPA: type IVB secretion system protein IcmH/DotU [Stellaceae bacterium]|nr:type IVB secretion system protein IcmH/DotU [Stellaceae bacterium]